MDPSRPDDENTGPPSLRHRTSNASSPCTSSETERAPPTTCHLNEKTNVYNYSGELESQAVTHDATTEDDTQTSAGQIQDGPVGLGQLISRLRPSTWWFVGALLIAIPLSVFATILSTTTISGIRITGFILWLEILWTAGWSIRLSVWLAGKGWYQICQLGLDGWEDFLLDTSVSQLMFFLSLVAWGSSRIMCKFSDGTCNVHWLHILQKVLLATIPATGIFLVKDLLLGVIIIRQTSRMVDTRKDIIRRQSKAFQLIMSMLTEEQEQTYWRELKLWLQEVKSFFLSEKRCIFLRKRSPTANDFSFLLMRYLDGHDRDEDFEVDNETFVDQMRNICREMYKDLLTDSEGNVTEDLGEEFFRKMLDLPRIKKLNNSSRMGGIPLTAQEMLKILDKDGNDMIGLEEWVEANVETFMALRDVSKSAKGFYNAAKSVDVVVSCLLLCIVAILYAAFFTKHLSNYLTPIWTTITGLSFALSGTVTDFITACGFVFSKQPYDIGDRVVIEDKDLIVDKICLLYTVFHRASDGAIEQIAHKKICDSWITNLSRSRGLSVKEAAAVPESAITVSKSTLDSYKIALENFIKENPVRSRYLNVGNFHISLQSGKEGARQVVAVIKLRELIVRREDILAGVRNEVRDKLEELVKNPLVTS